MKFSFVEEAHRWHKQWSAWLSAAGASVLSYLWMYPETLKQVADQLPDEVRASLSPILWIVLTATPIVIRNLQQKG